MTSPERDDLTMTKEDRLEHHIGSALFGTEDGGFVPDQAELPVGELWRLLREVAIPRLIREGWTDEPTAELSALRAENERLALLLNDANTRLDERRKMCDEYEADARRLLKAKVTAEGYLRRIIGHYPPEPTQQQLVDLDRPGTGDTTQPGDDAIDRAAWDLHRWNTEDTWHPRFVIHDLGDQDEDPYVALVRKVAGLLATRPCPSCATPAPSMSHNDGITDMAHLPAGQAMVDDLVDFWHSDFGTGRQVGELLDDAARELLRKWRSGKESK